MKSKVLAAFLAPLWFYISVCFAGPPAVPPPPTASQAEAEAGTETGLRSWSPLRVGQAVAALAGEGATEVSDAAYDAGTWDGDTTHAPSKNAIRDKVEALQPLDTDLTTLANPTAWRMFYSNGSQVVSELAVGAVGTALIGQGATSAPIWSNAPSLLALTLYGQSEGAGAQLALGSNSSSSDPNDGKIIFRNLTNTNTFTVASGASGAALSWTLPTAAPGGANYLLNVDADGTMGYTDPAGLGGYTNLTSFVAQTAWRIFYSNADGDVTELALGSDGEYLKSNGAAAAPTWATPSGAAHDAVTLSAAAGSNLLSLSTQEIGLDTQTANYVFAGPTSGDPAAPAFRALGASDIPDLSSTYLTALTAGTYIDVTGSTINVDLTETDDITWGAAAGGSQTWTFDTGSGTDPTMAIDETTGFTFNKPVVATSFSTGSSADPTLTLSDSDNAAGTAKIYGISGGGDNDIIMYLGVEIAGTTTDFIEIDGVSETIDLLKPVVTSSTVTAGGAVVPASANGAALGSATLEWADLFLHDGAVIYGQADQSATLTSSASLWTANNFAVTGYLALGADPADAGSIRLPNAGYIYSEADAAGTDISVIGVDSSEVVQIAASGASGVTITPATTITGAITSSGGITVADSQTITFDESAADPNDADIQLSATDGVFKIAAANGANNEDITVDLDQTANTAIINSSTGVTDIYSAIPFRAPAKFLSYDTAQTLTAATHNGALVMMTAAVEVTLWDCTASTIGHMVTLWARDAEKIEVVPATDDQFYLFNGTGIGANDELDMAATAGTKVTLMCTAANEWRVVFETAACADGGAAD